MITVLLVSMSLSALGTNEPTTVFRIYPNPHYSMLSLEFYQQDEGDVLVRLFNLNGNLIKTLYNGQLFAGSHQWIWSLPSDGPSTYIAVIETETGGYTDQLAVKWGLSLY